MGVTFRDGQYLRRVRLGKRTVKEGEAAALWNISGKHTEIIGPCRKALFFSTIRFLDRFTASRDQFLSISHINGTVEIIRGPHTMFMNPVKHSSIILSPVLTLSSPSEVLVTLRETFASGRAVDDDAKHTEETPLQLALGADSSSGATLATERRFVRGPCKFIPTAEEQVVSHVWDGRPATCILSTAPQQLARQLPMQLQDGSQVTVDLLITYQVIDLEKVLTVADPLSEMTAALKSDMAAIGQSHTGFTAHNTITDSVFADPAKLQRLCGSASRLGIKVLESTLQDLSLSPALASAIEQAKSSQRKLESSKALEQQRQEQRMAEENQKQQIYDLTLRNQQKRMAEEQRMSAEQAAHAIRIEKEKHAAAIEQREEDQSQRLRYLKALAELRVDVTEYLCTTAETIPTSCPGSMLAEARNARRQKRLQTPLFEEVAAPLQTT
jgi:regulator of protease activity HflC (stomatin/prohibitin superfamily)